MKSMMKILTRYVLSAAGVALILLIINFSVLAAWTAQSSKTTQRIYDIEQFADSLVQSGGGTCFPKPIEARLKQIVSGPC